jgi:hypothetical protein
MEDRELDRITPLVISIFAYFGIAWVLMATIPPPKMLNTERGPKFYDFYG